MATSDCFLAYIKSSLGFNFPVPVSSHDDISSLKRKAEQIHLALFPDQGPIVARAIKIMQHATAYVLPDSIPVRCFFDGADVKCFLLMDAQLVPPNPNPAETHCNDDASRGRDLTNGLVNQNGDTRCTSDAQKRKLQEGGTNRDTIVEEMNADKVAPSNEREPLRAGSTMQEINAATENENTDMNRMNGISVTVNPGQMPSLAPSGNDPNGSGKVTADGQINDTTPNSLPDSGREVNLGKTKQKSQPILETKKQKHKSREDGKHKIGKSRTINKSTTDPIVASEVKEKKRKKEAEKPDNSGHDEQWKKRVKRAVRKTPISKLVANFDTPGSNIAGSGSKIHANEVFTSGVGDSPLKFKGTDKKESVPEELRCHRNSGSGWRCRQQALPDRKHCSLHCRH